MEESAGPEPPAEALELLRIELEPERSGRSRPEALDGSLSRNALRKRRNWERRLAARRSRRADEKRRRKQLRRAEEAGGARTAGGGGGGEDSARHSTRHSTRAAKALVRQRLADARAAGQRLCVDLSVSDSMSAKETSRLAAQIRRLYGSNRRAARPFHLYLAGLRKDSLLFRECRRMNDGFQDYAMDVTERSFLELFPPDAIVYLTPDAEQALDLVDPHKVYILGGLVDESVRKKVTYRKACEGGVSSARLPIDEHMVKRVNGKNFHSQVLAINQVFDILLSFCDTGSWPAALARGVPPGKGYEVCPETVP
ncbi:tRNA methyltransferase 10 homolog B [Scleropages formosus]|uniref:tRNA methyltransferase 10 homolog B n=1 Tax=Scleropages formosus TaxID=113540 RepID=UPI0010FA96F9|nr:tRNA methyltransferase 10 homolog B [Scleropages formosus]